MEEGNETEVTQFILLGFSYPPHTKILLFVILLTVYLVNVAANSLFITVTVLDLHLHSPMYFFLCNLSLLDLCYSSAGTPTIFKGLLVKRLTVPKIFCIAQMYIVLSLGQIECFLLAVIAADRYVAICKPLNYPQIMTSSVCLKLAIVTWATGFVFSLTSVVVLPWAPFCGHGIVDHTLCEAEALSRITCMDNPFLELAIPILGLFNLVTPVSLVFFTYCRIIATILRMPTAESRRRTFATCGSHLIVVTLFYGSAMVVYMSPRSTASSEKHKSISIFYELVVPALNPLIYTLRNKDVKGAVKKLYVKNISSQKAR